MLAFLAAAAEMSRTSKQLVGFGFIAFVVIAIVSQDKSKLAILAAACVLLFLARGIDGIRQPGREGAVMSELERLSLLGVVSALGMIVERRGALTDEDRTTLNEHLHRIDGALRQQWGMS